MYMYIYIHRCIHIYIHIYIGKLEAYSIAVYVVTQTLTTVGYGDTSADNTAERVGYDVSDVSRCRCIRCVSNHARGQSAWGTCSSSSFIACARIWGDFLCMGVHVYLCIHICMCSS